MQPPEMHGPGRVKENLPGNPSKFTPQSPNPRVKETGLSVFHKIKVTNN